MKAGQEEASVAGAARRMKDSGKSADSRQLTANSFRAGQGGFSD